MINLNHDIYISCYVYILVCIPRYMYLYMVFFYPGISEYRDVYTGVYFYVHPGIYIYLSWSKGGPFLYFCSDPLYLGGDANLAPHRRYSDYLKFSDAEAFRRNSCTQLLLIPPRIRGALRTICKFVFFSADPGQVRFRSFSGILVHCAISK